jgi:squalene-hopene/tetraprenyl-beta-curcumene cyclase
MSSVIAPGNRAADASPATGPADPNQALQRGVAYLLSLQHDDGHWCAELEGDSILQSEYLLMKWILGQEDDPRLPRITRYLRKQQTPEGVWVQYPGGKMDISATVKGYFCLKLAGDSPDAEHMRKAREAILAGGGAEKCNSFTKFYLASLGQLDWCAQPSIPPEMVYLPRWFYFHLDKLASWTRTMVQPLSIVGTCKPVRRLPEHLGIAELYRNPKNRRRMVIANDRPHPFWSRFFITADKGLKLVDKLGMTPWRRAAIKRMEQWIIEHHKDSSGMGAIFPPMVYTLIAFRCLGYADDHPLIAKLHKDLDDFMVFEGGIRGDRAKDPGEGDIHIQPCFSPVWDTGITAYAMADAGMTDDDDRIARTRDWLLGKEVKIVGDWINNLPKDTPPAGWYFEYDNPIYPDCDDTVMVAMALERLCGRSDNPSKPGSAAALAAAKRGVNWVLAMQNPDGGWAAFDRGACDRQILEYIPFADHNAMQDPSCADITGRTLECLGWFGYRIEHPQVRQAVQFVKQTQRPEGCWFGRWGVNFIYGTWQAIGGMRRVGVDMNEDWIQRAGQWLKSVQREDGSFGETCDTYEDESLMGTGEPTASQTAWAAMTLLTIYGPEDPAVQRAMQWLADTQLADGSWRETPYTGTGFPRVFYLRYHYYKLYFPVMALGRYIAARQGA